MADLLFGYGSGWKAGGGFAYVGLSHLWGGDLPTDHELLANNTFKFGRRYQYQKAFNLGWKYSGLRVWKRNLRFGVQSYYDWGQRAGAVFADVEMNLASNLFVKMTADAIVLIDTKDPEVENGLFRDYRANDRLSLEVNYVF